LYWVAISTLTLARGGGCAAGSDGAAARAGAGGDAGSVDSLDAPSDVPFEIRGDIICRGIRRKAEVPLQNFRDLDAELGGVAESQLNKLVVRRISIPDPRLLKILVDHFKSLLVLVAARVRPRTDQHQAQPRALCGPSTTHSNVSFRPTRKQGSDLTMAVA
jgi:hypothetical protein